MMEVDFDNTGESALVILNDAILGITTENKIILTDLEPGRDNVLTLVPILENTRGNNVKVDLSEKIIPDGMFIPKVPNTGRAT